MNKQGSRSRLSPGLVSITFRKLTPREIIDLVVGAGLRGIEWGGDIHVPHGDTARAADVGRLTREAGLTVAAYGSYYKVGRSEAAGLSFARVPASAVALGAPLIRVWAGDRGPADTDASAREAITADARRIAVMAQGAGLPIAFEFHGGSLTETAESAAQLVRDVGLPNVSTLWQTPVGMDDAGCVASLAQALP
ncbi:MAG: TIM barrel protein, partial [Phycisphaeraceae bacterium]|nr:TIM barrel protein [Phycisphaeraceae bacterium]